MMTRSISVIVPVYNGRQTLPACLRALQHQTCPPNEVIVVDDGSTDDTAVIAARAGVTVLSQKNAGPAAARNHGAQAAQGDILLFTDADCVPAPDWVEQMVAPFADPTVAGVKGEYRTRQSELVARFVQQEYQDRYDRMMGQSRIDFVDTYAAAYRRDLFLAAGGFDSSFPTASVEDQEFSFRLAGQGYRLVFAPGAIVYHQHDRTLAEYVQRKFWIGYWKARVTRRYPAKLFRDSHTPQTLKAQMGLAAAGGVLLLLGGATGARGILSAGGLTWLLLLLSGLPFCAKIQHRDASVLPVTPVLLFLRAWSLDGGFILGNLHLILRR
ncbi:MAG: glycosyltransferase [Anaerolineae bacterium]|nr:glycosyltransferase [Anaerolineae bacterium]